MTINSYSARRFNLNKALKIVIDRYLSGLRKLDTGSPRLTSSPSNTPPIEASRGIGWSLLRGYKDEAQNDRVHPKLCAVLRSGLRAGVACSYAAIHGWTISDGES